MRYYDLSLTKTGATTPYLRWTSHPKGVYDPGALNIEFDMPTSTRGHVQRRPRRLHLRIAGGGALVGAARVDAQQHLAGLHAVAGFHGQL